MSCVASVHVRGNEGGIVSIRGGQGVAFLINLSSGLFKLEGIMTDLSRMDVEELKSIRALLAEGLASPDE